jgi:hypothetical protein
LIGYILGPKLVGAWQGSTPSKDTWDFFQHQFYFYNEKIRITILNFGNRPKKNLETRKKC